MKTYFGSGDRTATEELEKEIKIIKESPVMDTLLSSVGGLLAILDSNRQILSVNDSFCQMLGIENMGSITGLRPGEALDCVHAPEAPSGCGTGRYCSTCGAAVAIVSCLSGEEPMERKCLMEDGGGHDLSFLVKACSVEISRERFILLFLQDITLQEQRAALERTFFHDINNFVQSLSAASELIETDSPDPALTEIIKKSSRLLSRELDIQKTLLTGDYNRIRLNRQLVNVNQIIEEIKIVFCSRKACGEGQILFSVDSPGIELKTDLPLLIRIICNMITNALEVEDREGKITCRIGKKDGYVAFTVHNEGFIPEETARRIFQRNFSTKSGSGRGLGTFSMKLLGENVLRGKVGFTSTPDEGTAFTFLHPDES